MLAPQNGYVIVASNEGGGRKFFSAIFFPMENFPPHIVNIVCLPSVVRASVAK